MTVGTWFFAVFTLTAGAGMIGLWCVLLVTGKVPELHTTPASIRLHITAELATAAALITAGISTIAGSDARFTTVITAGASGALLYSLINSPGYYVDRRDRGMTALFAVIWVAALAAIILRVTV